MKNLFLTIAMTLVLSSIAQAELLSYRYTGTISESSNPIMFEEGDNISGTFTMSTTPKEDGFGPFIEQDHTASATFESPDTNISIANVGESHFHYLSYPDGTGINIWLTAFNPQSEITLEFQNYPTQENSIPIPIDFNLASETKLFIHKEGHYAEAIIDSVTIDKSLTCIEPKYTHEFMAVVNDNVTGDFSHLSGQLIRGHFSYASIMQLTSDEPDYRSYNDNSTLSSIAISLPDGTNFEASQTGNMMLNIANSPNNTLDFDGLMQSIDNNSNELSDVIVHIHMDDMSGTAEKISLEIPAIINSSSFSRKSLYIHSNQGSYEADIVEIKPATQAICNFDFSLNMPDDPEIANGVPVFWSTTIENKTDKKNFMAVWLSVELPDGLEIPLGGVRSFSVKANDVSTSKNYRFIPRNWQKSGNWNIKLNIFNKTTKEGPYSKSVIKTKN